MAVETVGNWYWLVDEIETAGVAPHPVGGSGAITITKRDRPAAVVLPWEAYQQLQRRATAGRLRELRDALTDSGLDAHKITASPDRSLKIAADATAGGCGRQCLLPAWLLAERHQAYADRLIWLRAEGNIDLCAPSLLAHEILNALDLAVRGKAGAPPRLTEEEAAERWQLFCNLSLELNIVRGFHCVKGATARRPSRTAAAQVPGTSTAR